MGLLAFIPDVCHLAPMPELPEVETVVREMSAQLRPGLRLSQITLHRADLRWPLPKSQLSGLVGESVRGVRRRAKYILIDFERHTLLSHLGMSGAWRFQDLEPRKHDHVEVVFENALKMVFNDPRRFGMLAVVPRGDEAAWPGIRTLGVEPLGSDWNETYLWERSRRRTQPMKSFLMDQSIVVGVGNIYASEALFRAGVLPTRPAGRLRRREVMPVVQSVKTVLAEAIASGGSTIRDFVATGGHKGSYQDCLWVYGREGEPCRVCGSLITQGVLSGRSTFWCRRCQT